MKDLLVLPIIIPMMTAAASLLAWRKPRIQRVMGVAGTFALLCVTIAILVTVIRHGIQATQMGAWPAPFGITLVADTFSAIMLVLAGLKGFSVAIYSLTDINQERQRFGYYPLLNFMLMGVCGAFLTGDLFNMYVWYEVMLISSFVLQTLGGERAQLEGAIKYVVLNLLSSAFFLAGLGILYGLMGTLNIADLCQKFGTTEHEHVVTALSMLFLVAFGIKAAVFPVFAWLPASYHTPPVAVSAIFAGLLTKVGVYSLIRVFMVLFTREAEYTHSIILAISALTMLVGVLGAMSQSEFRRILSFHIISQIGYMVMGLGLYTQLALAGSIFYILHHIIVKTNLFLVSGVTQKLRGSFHLRELGGLYHHHPYLSILFLIPAFSLAGIPPLSGFWAKFVLVQAGLQTEHYLVVAVALFVSLLTIYSMTKIWTYAFWKPSPKDAPPWEDLDKIPRIRLLPLVAPIVLLAAITVTIGLMMGPFFTVSMKAAEQLINPAEYIRVVGLLQGGNL